VLVWVVSVERDGAVVLGGAERGLPVRSPLEPLCPVVGCGWPSTRSTRIQDCSVDDRKSTWIRSGLVHGRLVVKPGLAAADTRFSTPFVVETVTSPPTLVNVCCVGTAGVYVTDRSVEDDDGGDDGDGLGTGRDSVVAVVAATP
jgi:hypothetical protein